MRGQHRPLPSTASFSALLVNAWFRKLTCVATAAAAGVLGAFWTTRLPGIPENDWPETAEWPTPELNAFLSYQHCGLSEKKANPVSWGWFAEESDFASLPPLCQGCLLGVLPRLWGSSLSPSSFVSVHCLLPTSTYAFTVLKLEL